MQGGPRASPSATKGRYGDNSTLVAVNFALPARQHCSSSSSSQLHDKAYTADTQAAFLNFDFGCENITSFRFGIC